MWNKALAWYTKYFAVWVVAGGVLAYVYPPLFTWLKGYNTYFFALTMFGIGAVLEPADFRRIAERPGIVAIGSAAQFLIMPLGAFVLARAFHLPDLLTVGLIIAGCAPGAMSSNVMCYIARADTAYSVSLTTVSTLLCPVLTPILTKLLAGKSVEVSFGQQFLTLLWTVVLPLWAGFAVRYFWKQTIQRIQAVFPAFSVTFIILICAMVIALNQKLFDDASLRTMFLLAAAAVVVLNLYGMAAGYGVGILFGMSLSRRRTLAIEIGMQNAGLGVILARQFGDVAMIAPAFFVFGCIITASVLVELWRRQSESQKKCIQNTVPESNG
ncbi:MAG: bile acid:sodium symporter family protein [Sedimentisphaerales bacterium]|nr:bile acid:sodium symporter family protein [Sedimentisphaerales bacterium]